MCLCVLQVGPKKAKHAKGKGKAKATPDSSAYSAAAGEFELLGDPSDMGGLARIFDDDEVEDEAVRPIDFHKKRGSM